MNFKDSINDLDEGKPISHADACIWLGVLTNDWNDAPTRGHLEKKVMRQSLVFLRDYSDMPEIDFMKPDLIETLDHKTIPNFGEIFKDEEKFLKYSIMAVTLERQRLNNAENKVITGDLKQNELFVQIGTDPKTLIKDLRSAAVKDRIGKPSLVQTLKDEAAILLSTRNASGAIRRRLYVDAFDAVFKDASPLTVMKDISASAQKEYEVGQESRVGQGRPRHPAPRP